MRSACAALLLAVGSSSPVTQAQYTFEMRLIPDGMAGSPGGPSPSQTFNIGNLGDTLPTRIGFWLQARVSQTSGQNWGITRASSPAGGGASFISVGDPAAGTSISRGTVNAGGTLFGRGVGYRNGGANSGNTGNTAGNAPFPGGAGNENGGLDNGGGGGSLMSRIYGFDSYVGPTRADTDFDADGDGDDDGDGLPENPWGVNGAMHPANVSGTPVPNDGTFSPWANLYRFWFDIHDMTTQRTAVISAAALLNGAVQAAPTSPGGATYAMQLSAGQTLQTTFSLQIPAWPTPGAASLLALGALTAARRRR